MIQLAYDANGYPIALPANARKWLVRKHRAKAPPQVLFRNGQRVTLPIEGSVTDLRYQVNDQPARYRLVALDEMDQPIEGLAEAYVEIEPEPSAAPFLAPAASTVDPLATSRAALAQSPTELLLFETMRAHTEIARSMVERMPDMLKASAYLIQAADAAGMPRRRPLDLDDDYDDDFDDDYDDAPPPPEPRSSSMIETFLKTALLGGGGLGGFAKLLGAGDSTAPAAGAPATAAPTAAPPPPTAPSTTAPTTSAPVQRNARPVDTQAHLFGVLAQLTADERAYAERVFAQLSPAAVQQWHELLLSMSVDEAVAMIRAKAKGEES